MESSMAAGLPISGQHRLGPKDRDILGVRVADLTQEAALERLMAAMAARTHAKVAFCNAHTANTAIENPSFNCVLTTFFVLPDGVGVDIASRWLHGHAFAANLNGTDFVPALLKAARVPLSVALIGARPGVAARAAEALAMLGPGHRIGPVLDGYAGATAEAEFLRTLAAAPVDLLLVAMGNPRQEFWIASNVDERHCTIAMGVGALFDFAAGEFARAPESIRRLRLEWLWRLMQEPRRLFRRYVVGNPRFLVRAALALLDRNRRP
jgi:exopolysaccharide biosynthesis WecB/TagA/CpsF family protein